MRRATPLVPVVAALLVLTACGSEQSGTRQGGAGEAAGPASGAPVTDPPVDGVRITSVTIPSPSPSPKRSYSVQAERLPGDSGISAAYEVTNGGTEALTYEILFHFTTDSGASMANREVTVRDVRPGATARGTVELGVLQRGASAVTRVKVGRVTKVPAAEAPPAPGDCPEGGVRVTVDDGDAAMGLRVVGLHLENCGTSPYSLDGYPELTLLDDGLKPVDGVTVVHGSGGISTGTRFDEPPRPLTLKPGEKAVSGLMWRNTTQFGEPVNVPYVRVRAKAGAAPVTVTPHLDLGTTGKLAVRAWAPAPEETDRKMPRT
ncbi:DUF4232 domain-containing protein [Streptomyces sp. bgisy153]|uniref:DUF4232 domain-containing protein n=1 Tax=Streptomyces sp. bgisy153 TaxID=3413793 RepID=UPI003D70A7EE